MADMYGLFEERFHRQLNLMKSYFDQQDKKLDELTGKMRETRQRFAGLEHDARQPCLVIMADVKPDTKTRKRTEDTEADRAKYGDSSSAKRVDAGPTSSASFGMIAEAPALPCRDDALDDKGAKAPKPCLSPMEMRTLIATGGILTARTVFTATRTIFHQSTL